MESNKTKNVIITGATGMVGELVLKECLKHPSIGQVTSISRSPLRFEDKKLIEIRRDDFTDYTSIEQHFKNVSIAYFCLGVYTGQVSRDEFRAITIDYTRVFVETLKKNSPQAVLCFLSGQGADQKEKSRFAFAKDKGIAENLIIKQNLKETYIFRPAYIYPEIPRKEPNFTYRLMRKLYPIYNKVFPTGSITSVQLAKAMFKVGLEGADKMILENQDIQQIVENKI